MNYFFNFLRSSFFLEYEHSQQTWAPVVVKSHYVEIEFVSIFVNPPPVLQSGQDLIAKASHQEQLNMKYFPGLALDNEPLWNCFWNRMKIILKAIFASNVSPKISMFTDSSRTVPPIELMWRGWGRLGMSFTWLGARFSKVLTNSYLYVLGFHHDGCSGLLWLYVFEEKSKGPRILKRVKLTQWFFTHEIGFYFIEYLFYELKRSSAITLGMLFPSSGHVDPGVGRPSHQLGLTTFIGENVEKVWKLNAVTLLLSLFSFDKRSFGHHKDHFALP